MKRKSFVIVNPQAAGGSGRRQWATLADQLMAEVGLFDYEFTNARGSATLLATEAIHNGYNQLIAVGGDGTVNEVLNGMFDETGAPLNSDVVLGCLPAGSGTDFWKTLGIPERLPQAVRHMAHDKTTWCDVGRVELQSRDGKMMHRYFCNVADVGLGGEVVDRAKRLPQWSNGLVNYFIAALTSTMQWKPAEMTFTIDGVTHASEELTIALIANGQYCGGGMRIAPDATLDSGFFQVVLVRPLNPYQALHLIPKLYTGRLATLDTVTTHQARELTIEAAGPLKVTLDGEVCGRVPVTFRILPRAVRVQAGA